MSDQQLSTREERWLDDHRKRTVERIQRNRSVYRRTFETQEGIQTLTAILNDLGFFNQHIETPAEVAKANAARQLLYNLGIWQDANRVNIVAALMRLPYDHTPEQVEVTSALTRDERAIKIGPHAGGPRGG